ncbi:MAG: efflux RND transporter periplasmic adaptor subunit [Desulfosarcina sp.]|nr:efflux RND transporter periplasmic adaptor subunit [Desulfosarcina sp.]MBC2743818.1 efflux RND transporter periplasmic adaptor subunit [Desulfosarcina sp.]MBC2766727.1 efflux RND transporter periplasmic adaptor subunit [Desulfosarcina sp.]
MKRKRTPLVFNDLKKMKRCFFMTALTMAMAMAVIFCGCGKKEEPAPKEIVRPVKVMTVQGGAGSVSMTYPGKTRANRRVNLSFKVPGPLVELPVEEGQEVNKGQLIARILPRDFKINLDQVKARAIEAERQYDRYKELYVRKQVSKAEFDRFKASRDVAAAQLEDAQNALKDTYLKAPFDGIVAKRHVENFEEVQAKQPIVFFQDLSKIEVLVDAPETVVVTLGRGERIEATATFAAAPDINFPLELKEYSTQADPQTQTYQVVLVMDRPEGINILPGMTATVIGKQAAAGDSASRIVIPAIAVMEDPQEKAFVWVLKKEDMTVHKTAVTVGEMTGSDSILVLDGLEGGEQIATSGVTKLQDGMKVSIWKE